MVERLEEQLLKYPRQRVWQLEREVAFEKTKLGDSQRKIQELDQTISRNTNFQLQLNEMAKEISEMAKKIQDETLPATLKVTKLKTHVLELYKRLGYDVTTSQYHTLVESHEFSELGPIVSTMLAKAADNENPAEQELKKQE